MEGFCSLGSGSKGNMTVLRGSKSIYLVDAGFSLKKTTELLAKIDIDLKNVQGILITHDHHDHIVGLEAITNQYDIPIYANCETAKVLHETLPKRPKFKIFENGVSFHLDEFTVYPFSIPHDTVDPVAYTFSWKDKKLGICTDIGFATPLAIRALKGCTHLLIEANHEVSLVHACNRPAVYKRRVLSKQGHLSNEESRSLIDALLHEDLELIALAHLSQECNAPEIALKAMSGITVPIHVLHQEGPNPFFAFNAPTKITSI